MNSIVNTTAQRCPYIYVSPLARTDAAVPAHPCRRDRTYLKSRGHLAREHGDFEKTKFFVETA